MVPELEKPRVTEILVRMDCNGCVQKIKKALYGINGIYDVYIDLSQQKLTVIGWADPEKIMKAIKKTRKVATLCSVTEQSPPESLPPPEGEAPPPDPSNDAPPAEPETLPPAEPPKEPTPPDNPPPDSEAPPPLASAEPLPRQPQQPSEVEEVHVVYRYPPQAIHSYNTYKPTPYVTEFEYIRPPPLYTRYAAPEPPQYTPEPPQYTPEPPQHTPEPPPLRYTTKQPPRHTPEPPLRYTPEPPQRYTPVPPRFTSEPPRYTPEPPRYTPELPRYTPEPPQRYTREPPRYTPEPPRYTPEPPRRYTHYSRAEPPAEYTHYARPETPRYIHYNGDYQSSNNGNGNITSIFSDENPNACKIV